MSLQLKRIRFELDSQVLVEMLIGRAHMPWHIAYIIRKIKFLLKYETIELHILREGNNISDFFAKLAMDRESNEIFMSYVEVPKEVRGMLKMDR